MDRYYQQLFMSLLKAIHLVLISQHNNEYVASQEGTGKQVSNFNNSPFTLPPSSKIGGTTSNKSET
jgi:hypothetical protein